MENYKHLLIISDSHVLTPSIVKVFQNNSSWKIFMINTIEQVEVDKFLHIDIKFGFSEENLNKIYLEIENFTNKFDAMIHLSGNWEKSSLKSINILCDNLVSGLSWMRSRATCAATSVWRHQSGV